MDKEKKQAHLMMTKTKNNVVAQNISFDFFFNRKELSFFICILKLS